MEQVSQQTGARPAPPFTIWLAAVVAYCKAAFDIVMGLIGVLAADSVGDDFAIFVVVFGVAYGLSGLLVRRGSRAGRELLGLLSLAGAAIGLYYAFTGPSSAVISALVAVAFGGGVLALLYLPQASRAYFAR
ncbi:MAG TPA: hypothetical protein VH572_04675 [Gaiella sp.]|jgi:hypothetical protein